MRKMMALVMLALIVFPSFSAIMVEAMFTFGDTGEVGEYNSHQLFDGGAWKGRWTNYRYRPLQGWRPTITWNETAIWNKTGPWSVWMVSWNRTIYRPLQGWSSTTAWNMTSMWNETCPWGVWMGSWNRTFMWNETAVWSRWNVDKQVGLSCAVERALRFIDRINATTERLEEGYEDEVLQIREKLRVANGSLTDLMEKLESDEVTTEEAAQELASIRKMLGEAMRLLSTVTKKVKAVKVEGFLRRMEGCVLGNETLINRFQHSFVKGPTVVSTLSDIKGNLLDI